LNVDEAEMLANHNNCKKSNKTINDGNGYKIDKNSVVNTL